MSDARRALLERLIDHAALFPPASMSIADALAEDARVRSDGTAWIVNRFVVPLSKLDALGDAPLRLSVVLDVDAPLPDDPRIEAVETVPRGTLEDLVGLAPEVYVELPPGDRKLHLVTKSLGLRAKVRCGGASVPSVEELAGFIAHCRELQLPFKATAGLHHAMRTEKEHGFLNLLAAAVFGDEAAALAETDLHVFINTSEGFGWRDRVVSAEEVARVRRELFVGFGSCSVQEPVDELRALGYL